ncbi:hypothetical protein J6590_105107, partial [Homalodisca vitripennis]
MSMGRWRHFCHSNNSHKYREWETWIKDSIYLSHTNAVHKGNRANSPHFVRLVTASTRPFHKQFCRHTCRTQRIQRTQHAVLNRQTRQSVNRKRSLDLLIWRQ